MPFQPEDIACKQFLVRARGYDRDEVAAFLRAVAADYGAVLQAFEQAAASPPEAVAPTNDGDTERRAADLLDTAARRLEEVAERERRGPGAERRGANHPRAGRRAREAGRGSGARAGRPGAREPV